MEINNQKDINELVGGDMYSNGGDRNPVNNSEIETGPVDKSFNDHSEYEKGEPTTTDKVFGRYRQNIPWFAVYSYGGTRAASGLRTFESVKVSKNSLEEKIEDLVKKGEYPDLTNKADDLKFKKILNQLKELTLTDDQKDEIKKTIKNG